MMTGFKLHTPETAPSASQEILDKQRKALGFCPNLFAGLAESPQALEAYVSLDAIFSETTLSPQEQQLVLLAISTENNCGYCQAAHSTLAMNQTDLTQQQLNAVQAGRPVGDEKLDELIYFTRALVKQHANMTKEQVSTLLNVGYTHQNLLEIILATAMKTLSNYGNHLMKTPIDDAFQPQLKESA